MEKGLMKGWGQRIVGGRHQRKVKWKKGKIEGCIGKWRKGGEYKEGRGAGTN